MKKINIFIITLLLCVFAIPNVFAASATTQITGTNKITVGKTTTIYVKLKASDLIKGADVTYKSSGNIKVTNVSVGNGLSKMGQNGNRYILYSNSGIKSGSTILALTVKGTAVGKGTITVSKMEATVSGVTVNGGSKSYTITVTEVKKKTLTEAEKKAKEEAAKKAEEERKAKEAEKKAKEAAQKQAEKDALELVEKAEKTLADSDYESAKKAVDALNDSDVKKDLTKRLQEVRFKIEVNKEVEKKCGNTNNQSKECKTECETRECNSKSWIILCIILFICLLFETIYLISKLNKRESYE